MNGSVSRRVFVGSVAAAGVGAAGATSLLEFPVAAQPAATDPLIREIHRQLKDAIGKMRDGQSSGARQLSTTLRIYSSTVDDNQLRAALRKANRQQILLADVNHGELVQQAEELGINPSTLPSHSVDRVGREAALDRLLKEGLTPLMVHVADFVDQVGVKMGALERSGRARPLQVALRQPIPEPTQCYQCDQEKAWVDGALHAATVICAAAAALPVLIEFCAAASAAYLAFYLAYSVCLMILALCEYYYGN